METPHVLYVIDLLVSTYGGAEGVLWRMTKMLPRDRYRCSVVTFSSDPSVVPVHMFDCPVHLMPLNRTYDQAAFRQARALSRLIRKEKVSIVHTFFPTSDLFGGLIARLSGVPVVISSRRDMGLLRRGPHPLIYRYGSALWDEIHAVSEQVRQHHIKTDHLPPEKVVTVPNGVDLEKITTAPARDWPAEWNFKPGTPVVACVAHIREVKGIDVLVRAAARVCEKVPEARFVVVGESQEAEYCRGLVKLAESLGVKDSVVFAGGRTDVFSLLKRCSIFMLPSRSEGLSNAMLEAMACNLPCVATDVGGNKELVAEGVNGFLFPNEDDAAGAERVLELLGNAELRERMGRESRRIVESKFSLDMMMSQLLTSYDQLLARKSRAYAAAPQTNSALR